jgi:hypothetical protein
VRTGNTSLLDPCNRSSLPPWCDRAKARVGSDLNKERTPELKTGPGPRTYFTTETQSRQLPKHEESNERKMKHVIDTQWVSTPTRERLAATRKRTLRSAAARHARSVWSKCQSRVIDSRNSVDRSGLPALCRGDNIAVHTISRHPRGAQATCTGTGPGAESGAKAYGGILGSWESRTALSHQCRNRTPPAHQRPGAWAVLPAVGASESREAARVPASEGNRSARASGGGSLSRCIVAVESRRTSTGGSL